MYEPGKLYNTVREIKRLHIRIIGISKMCWHRVGNTIVDDYIYSILLNRFHLCQKNIAILSFKLKPTQVQMLQQNMVF